MDREAKMKQLRARMRESGQLNRKEVIEEHKRLKLDPRLQAKQDAKRAEAARELEMTNLKETGKDIDRLQAWDYTIADNERWNEKLREKEQNRVDTKFSNFGRLSELQYQKVTRSMKPMVDKYIAEKEERKRSKALARQKPDNTKEEDVLDPSDGSGDEDVEAVHLGFVPMKPSKAGIDLLVADIKREEAKRARSKRNKDKEGNEVTYINHMNKAFNEKAARAYDSYTKEIKESLERGTGL